MVSYLGARVQALYGFATYLQARAILLEESGTFVVLFGTIAPKVFCPV